MNFTGIKSKDIPSFWPHAADLIQRGIDTYGEFSLEEVYQALINGQYQLWVAGDKGVEAILITHINSNVCYVEICAGDGIKSLSYLKVVEKWAGELGCTSIEISGRRGWAKVLKDYKIKKIILRKSLYG